MSIIFSLAKATAIVDGKEIDLGAAVLNGISPENKKSLVPTGMLGRSYTLRGTFKLTNEGYAFLVGLQLRYNLRQLHQNLGRYTRWPYTN